MIKFIRNRFPIFGLPIHKWLSGAGGATPPEDGFSYFADDYWGDDMFPNDYWF